MALSNIFNEPRREITESVLGAVLTLVPFGFVTRWFYLRWVNPTIWETGEIDKDGNRLISPPFDLEGCAGKCAHIPTHLNLEVLVAALGVALAICIVGWIIIFATHRVGEELCDALAEGKLDPRPRNRAR